MFNLSNLSEKTVILWLTDFKQQIEDKLSAINYKLSQLSNNEINTELEELNENIENLPRYTINLLHPVGTVLLIHEETFTQEKIEDQYGGTWSRIGEVDCTGVTEDSYLSVYIRTA